MDMNEFGVFKPLVLDTINSYLKKKKIADLSGDRLQVTGYRNRVIKLAQQPFQSVDLFDPVVGSQRNESHGNQVFRIVILDAF